MLKISKKIKIFALVGALSLGMAMPETMVFATQNNQNQTVSRVEESITNDEKSYLLHKLEKQYSYLKITYLLSDETKAKMEKVYNDGVGFIKRNNLPYSDMLAYEAKFEEELNELATENNTNTNLMLSNLVPVTTARYGEETFVVLSLINLGKTNMRNVVITPEVGTTRETWPFEIQNAYDAKSIEGIECASSIEEANKKRMDIGWTFKVREDVLNGCYPLKFNAKYFCEDGTSGETKITTYINIIGKDPKKSLEEAFEDDEDDLNLSSPRVIVTGYTTEPEVVFAGSVFKLTISLQNTSSKVDIENVLFKLSSLATSGAGSNSESYEPFLPTSGSNSVFVEKIAAGETYELNIEMKAKADLSQKPYVLNVNAEYFYGKGKEGSGSAEVSIPVKQESKMDTGTVEVVPEYINVGNQSNIMFSIFNTGKTILYNVKVNYESDAIESGVTYIGNLAPGNTGNVDSMVTGIAQGDGQVMAVITYEDESGNETRVEKAINLQVDEMIIEEFPGDIMPEEFENPEENEGGISKVVIIVASIVAAVVVLIVIIVIIKKKRNKKKQKEDIDLLDEDDL